MLAQQTVGELFATDASVKGSVIMAGSGTSVVSGSQIAAGAQTATLKLERGGNVHVCPGTSLSVTSSQNGRQMLFSVNSGSLELDYPLGSAADTLLTPDFRLLLPGPGQIHVAVRITASGDTCVQSLPANVSSLVIAEAMGDESYQVKPNEAVLFKAGHIAGATASRQSCGCPAPPPVQVAKSVPQPVVMPAPAAPATAATPETYVSVDAPFIFHGDDTPPNLTENVAHLKIDNEPMVAMQPVVLPPAGKREKKAVQAQTAAADQPEQKRGFFGKVGDFFASIFH